MEIRRENHDDAATLSTGQHNLRMVLEYILAAASVANVILNSWNLSNRTIHAAGCQIWGFPILWTVLTVPVHFFGAVAVYLRVELRSAAHASRTTSNGPRFLPASIWKHVREEFRLSISQQHQDINFRKRSYFFLLASWWASTFTILHIIWGTLVLGSTLFIGPPDATTVVAQYLVSTLICRAIVSFEMEGIRRTAVSEERAVPAQEK